MGPLEALGPPESCIASFVPVGVSRERGPLQYGHQKRRRLGITTSALWPKPKADPQPGARCHRSGASWRIQSGRSSTEELHRRPPAALPPGRPGSMEREAGKSLGGPWGSQPSGAPCEGRARSRPALRCPRRGHPELPNLYPGRWGGGHVTRSIGTLTKGLFPRTGWAYSLEYALTPAGPQGVRLGSRGPGSACPGHRTPGPSRSEPPRTPRPFRPVPP